MEIKVIVMKYVIFITIMIQKTIINALMKAVAQ